MAELDIDLDAGPASDGGKHGRQRGFERTSMVRTDREVNPRPVPGAGGGRFP